MSKLGRKEYSAARLMAVYVKVREECKRLDTDSVNAACESLAARGDRGDPDALFHGAYTADGTARFVKLSASGLSGVYYRAKRKYAIPR